MGFRETKRNADVKKISEVVKQGKVENQSETTEQRFGRNTRFWYDLTKVKAVGTGLLLAMAGMSGALADQSRSLQTLAGSDHATGLLPASNQQGQFIGYHPPERYVPSAKDMEQYRAFLEKMNHPPFYFGPNDAQATPSGETSQAAMETQEGEQDSKKKGKDLK